VEAAAARRAAAPARGSWVQVMCRIKLARYCHFPSFRLCGAFQLDDRKPAGRQSEPIRPQKFVSWRKCMTCSEQRQSGQTSHMLYEADWKKVISFLTLVTSSVCRAAQIHSCSDFVKARSFALPCFAPSSPLQVGLGREPKACSPLLFKKAPISRFSDFQPQASRTLRMPRFFPRACRCILRLSLLSRPPDEYDH
jgi:hypothetical protein